MPAADTGSIVDDGLPRYNADGERIPSESRRGRVLGMKTLLV